MLPKNKNGKARIKITEIMFTVIIVVLGIQLFASIVSATEVLQTQKTTFEYQDKNSNFYQIYIEPTTQTDMSKITLAPPPGSYSFRPGDHVLLRAYDMQNKPVAIHWSGDISVHSPYLYLELTSDITISVEAENTTSREENNTWFDVPESHAVYTFVGGGNLYGWFKAERNKDCGAGITKLTHKDNLWMPLLNNLSLNFEHIFTGKAADYWRSLYTPRIDPMQFAATAPGTVCIRWNAPQSTWKIDCEMQYCFSGGDSIDISFSAIPQEDLLRDYIGFMWATYLDNARERAIFFPGFQNSRREWISFGPMTSEKKYCTVDFKDAPELHYENGSPFYNILSRTDLFFTEPFFYGVIYQDRYQPHPNSFMNYVMMFDSGPDMRFAVWNWGYDAYSTAWDWQYILRNPVQNQRYEYHARFMATPLSDPDSIHELYLEWRSSLESRNQEELVTLNKNQSYPLLKHYWSAADSPANLISMGKKIEHIAPEYSLEWYRYLFMKPESMLIGAEAINQLFLVQYDYDGLVKEWLYWTQEGEYGILPWIYLGNAYLIEGDMNEAETVFKKVLEMDPGNPIAQLYFGMTQIELNDYESGLDHIADSVCLDASLASSVGALIAEYAEKAAENQAYCQAEYLYLKAKEIAPNDHWHAVHLAEILEKRGDDEQALSLYEEVLKKAPESPYAANSLDALLLRRDMPEARLQLWISLHDAHPDAVIPALYLGKARYDSGNYEKARDLLAKVLEKAPKNAEIPLYLGAAQLQLNDLEIGLTHINAALQLDTGLGTTATAMIAERAAKAFEDQEHDLAETLYRKAKEMAPNDRWHAVHLAELLEKRGDDEQARSLYEEVLKKAPESPYAANSLDALLLRRDMPDTRLQLWISLHDAHPDAVIPALHLGKAWYDSGNYERARGLLSNMLEKAPGNAEIPLYLGVAQLRLNDLQTGFTHINKALQLDAGLASTAASMITGCAARAFEDQAYDLAETLHRKAKEMAPNDHWHAVHLAELLEKRGEDEQALSLYEEVLKKAPESPYAASNLDTLLLHRNMPDARLQLWISLHDAHPDAVIPALYLGKARYDSDDYEKARGLLSEVLEKAPGNAEISLYLGAAQVRLNDLQTGLTHINVALQLDAGLASTAASIIVGHAARAFEDQAYDLAETLYRKAKEMAPHDHWHAVHLAELLEKRGDSEQALSLYEEVLKKAPESPYAASNLDTLLLRHDMPDARLQLWISLHDAHPDAVIPALYLGKARYDSGNYEKARGLLSEVLEKAPGNAELSLYLGAAQVQLNDPEAGLAHINDALQRDAGLVSTAAGLIADSAQKAFEKQSYEYAVRLYRKANELVPNVESFERGLSESLKQLENVR